MTEEELMKVNINDFKIEELTLEEQEAFNYFKNTSEEITFETNIDGDKFFEALGIKKEENFGKMQYRISTLLNLIEKQQSKIDKAKNKLKKHIKHCENENAHLYDKCSINLKFNKGLLKILEE